MKCPKLIVILALVLTLSSSTFIHKQQMQPMPTNEH